MVIFFDKRVNFEVRVRNDHTRINFMIQTNTAERRKKKSCQSYNIIKIIFKRSSLWFNQKVKLTSMLSFTKVSNTDVEIRLNDKKSFPNDRRFDSTKFWAKFVLTLGWSYLSFVALSFNQRKSRRLDRPTVCNGCWGHMAWSIKIQNQ